MKHKHLAKWFKDNRTRRGLTLRDVRIALGVTYEGYIENIEAGRKKPPMEKVSTLCKFFGVGVETFIAAMVADFRDDITSQIKEGKAVNAKATKIETDEGFGGLL